MQKERCLLGCLKENKRAVNKIKCHPELDSGSHLVSVLESGEIPNQVWNDSINNNAFTLIELLVVVLIIGILAAVALPQYKKAVWKSRAAQLYTDAKVLHEAKAVYYLANGTYATSFDELALEPNFNKTCPGTILTTFPTTKDCRANDYSVAFIVASGSIFTIFHQGAYKHSGFVSTSNSLYCYENEPNKFCALMGYNTLDSQHGANYYYSK